MKEIVDRASLKLNCLAGQQIACEQIVNDVQKIKDLKFYFYSMVFYTYFTFKKVWLVSICLKFNKKSIVGDWIIDFDF